MMSTRRSRLSEITGDEIIGLVSKLQELIPKTRCGSSARTSTSNILKEACKYIKSLHREVDDLSEKLIETLASPTINSVEAEVLRCLLMQKQT